MSVAPTLVFAVGNLSRGDDAVGPLLAERLEAAAVPGVEVLVGTGRGTSAPGTGVAVVTGMIMASIHAAATVSYRVNQIVSGVAINTPSLPDRPSLRLLCEEALGTEG